MVICDVCGDPASGKWRVKVGKDSEWGQHFPLGIVADLCPNCVVRLKKAVQDALKPMQLAKAKTA